MLTIKLTSCLKDDIVDGLGGTLLDNSSFDILVEDDMDIYKPNGELLLKFRKRVLPGIQCKQAYENIREAASVTDNRGMAGGIIDTRKIRKSNMPVIHSP